MRIRRPSGKAGLAALPGLAAALALVAGCDQASVVSATATLSSSAGTVDVQCVGRTRIQIVGSAPAPGYTAQTIVAGPTHQASIRFSSPDANDFKIFVHCSDAQPFLEQLEIEDTTLVD